MIMLSSDHSALKRFLKKTTWNAKVNNLGVEISDYNTSFKFIKGIQMCLPIPY